MTRKVYSPYQLAFGLALLWHLAQPRPKLGFVPKDGSPSNRILRDDPSKSDMHNRQGITLSLMWKAMKDFDMYSFSEKLILAGGMLTWHPGGQFTCWA
jgi:hypothetical protein